MSLLQNFPMSVAKSTVRPDNIGDVAEVNDVLTLTEARAFDSDTFDEVPEDQVAQKLKDGKRLFVSIRGILTRTKDGKDSTRMVSLNPTSLFGMTVKGENDNKSFLEEVQSDAEKLDLTKYSLTIKAIRPVEETDYTALETNKELEVPELDVNGEAIEGKKIVPRYPYNAYTGFRKEQTRARKAKEQMDFETLVKSGVAKASKNKYIKTFTVESVAS